MIKEELVTDFGVEYGIEIDPIDSTDEFFEGLLDENGEYIHVESKTTLFANVSTEEGEFEIEFTGYPIWDYHDVDDIVSDYRDQWDCKVDEFMLNKLSTLLNRLVSHSGWSYEISYLEHSGGKGIVITVRRDRVEKVYVSLTEAILFAQSKMND